MGITVTEDEPVSDERLARLEERMSNLSGDMHDLKETNRSTADSLKKLVVLEERHRSSDEAMQRMFKAIETNSKRIEDIELQMPNISLASSWVFRAVLFIVALTGLGYIATLIKEVFGVIEVVK